MRARSGLIAAAATVLLAAGSVVAPAATGAGPAGPAARCTVPSPAGQRVRVVLADMSGMGSMTGSRMMLSAAPPTVLAGTVSFVAANHGTRAHELLVLPLPDGQTVGRRPMGADRTVAEAGSLGEASRGCGAGHGNGIAPGQVGQVTLTLRPGRYELLCNQPSHYAAGTYAEFDVT